MKEMGDNYEKVLALQQEVHGKYPIPTWIRNFLNDVSEGSVLAQPNYPHDKQISNANRINSLMLDIGYSLGITQSSPKNQIGNAVTALAMLVSGLNALEPDEAAKITKEIIEMQKDMGEKDSPEKKYIRWALAILSPAAATLVLGNFEEYVSAMGSLLSAFYVLGRYDATAEDVPEAWDFDGLEDTLKGLGK